jgi:DNA-binding CsgD family transcriptional regulator
MERKWDKIDLNFISKQEKSKSNYKEIEKLLTVGKSIMQISDVLSMKYRTVYMAIRRSKINL